MSHHPSGLSGLLCWNLWLPSLPHLLLVTRAYFVYVGGGAQDNDEDIVSTYPLLPQPLPPHLLSPASLLYP